MNRFALALMGSAALTFGSVANAAVTIDAGTTVSTTGPTTVGSTTTIGYSDTEVPAAINENIVFTNTLAGLYAITLTTSSSAINFASAILSGTGGPYALTKTVDDGTNEFWNFTSPSTRSLAAGQYTLNILGTNTGAGSLGGSITISAVPEPASWALMLLGFGGMGFALRRGRKQGIMQLA